jgi:hypothetical protein
METTPVVAAFSDSPLLRETLAVLLERDCHLEFFSPSATASAATLAPDLAVLATQSPSAVLHDLVHRWPQIPIIAIDPQQIGGRELTPMSASAPNVHTVPLEPQAIRAAVIDRLPTPPPDSQLRAIAERIGATLRAELRYSFTMLRSFSAFGAPTASRDTDAILAAILCEQASVIGEHVEHLERFCARPRAVALSTTFVSTLCRQLAQPDTAATQRGLLCTCSLDTASPAIPGPTALAPLVATLVRAHLRRRSELSVINISAAAHRVSMRYKLRAATPSMKTSWPLLLADLLLEPSAWRTATSAGNGHETLTLLGVT